MNKTNELNILGSSRLDKWNEFEIYFLLKAWKILSESDITDDSLKFDTFYNDKIESKKLVSIWKELAKKYKVFGLYMHLSSLGEMEPDVLEKFIKAVKNELVESTVNDAFYSIPGMHKSIVSNQISELGMKLLDDSSDSVYVPFTNGFAYVYQTDKMIYAEESIFDQGFSRVFIVELIKIIDNKRFEFKGGDTLVWPGYVKPNAPHILKQFDSVLSFPPFGLKGRLDVSEDRFNRFKLHKGTNLNVAHFEHILAQTKGKAVVLLPVGFTYRTGTEESLRKYLVDENLLEAIIQLPPNLHNDTSIETTFFIVNKQKQNDTVLFINLKDERFLKKDRKKITFKDLSEILEIYDNKKEIDSISKNVSNEDIKSNDYSYAIDRYVISKEAAKTQRKLSKYEAMELQDVAEIRRSQMFKDEEDKEAREIHELSPSDMAKAGLTSSGSRVKHIKEQMKKLETYVLKDFDILLSTKGTIGKVGIVKCSDTPVVASQSMQVIRLNSSDNRDVYVLYMYLKSDVGQAQLRQLVSGTAMPQISTSDIKKLKIPVLSEKEKAYVIDNYYKEEKLYKEMKKIEAEIEEIHENYL